MATYTIIGGDQKQYGSVTADDLRKWIADGRLNAQSLAKEESDTEFRPTRRFLNSPMRWPRNATPSPRSRLRLPPGGWSTITISTLEVASAAAGIWSKIIFGRSWV